MSKPRESLTLIGVDPGATTGVFMYHYRALDRYWPGAAPYEDTEAHQVLSGEVWELLWNRIDELEDEDCVPHGNIHIAVEKYIITARTAKLSQQPDALEVTGVVKAVAAQSYSKPSVRQYLKSNLRFASDAMLKAVGWSTPGNRHANDAARQAFALLKDIDPPRWHKMVADASLEAEEDGRTQR